MILNLDPSGPNAIPLPGSTAEVLQGNPTPKKLNFLGWAVLILALYAWNGTNIGHEAIFYSMALIVLFLFIYNYQSIFKAITK
jgi:hypothetical protein